MTDHIIRGRRRIAHELGLSERTVSRRAAAGLLDVLYEPAENNNVMVLDPCGPWQSLASVTQRLVAHLSDENNRQVGRSAGEDGHA